MNLQTLVNEFLEIQGDRHASGWDMEAAQNLRKSIAAQLPGFRLHPCYSDLSFEICSTEVCLVLAHLERDYIHIITWCEYQDEPDESFLSYNEIRCLERIKKDFEYSNKYINKGDK